MGSYGRNFDFRVPPVHGERGGRYVFAGDAEIPIGAPVVVADGATPDAALTNALPVELATGAQGFKRGLCGIVVYEWIDLHYLDPVYYNYSDRGMVPVGKLVQVVAGGRCKVVFRNTEDRTFLQTREYAGKIMVAGAGATPTVAVGDFLTPGVGNDDDGYWAETADVDEAWLVVETVDVNRGEVEARFNF